MDWLFLHVLQILTDVDISDINLRNGTCDNSFSYSSVFTFHQIQTTKSMTSTSSSKTTTQSTSTTVRQVAHLRCC